MEPWICPRCQTVWAGWVAQCRCSPVPSTSSNTASSSTVRIPVTFHLTDTDWFCRECNMVIPAESVHTCMRPVETLQ